MKRRFNRSYEIGHIFENWPIVDFESYLKAQKTFDNLERKRSNFELYREAARCQNEDRIPNFILQKLDYKCLVTSNQGVCSLLDRSTHSLGFQTQKTFFKIFQFEIDNFTFFANFKNLSILRKSINQKLSSDQSSNLM